MLTRLFEPLPCLVGFIAFAAVVLGFTQGLAI